MKISSAHLDGVAMAVFMIAVVLTIVYMLDYSGVITVIPAFFR